MGSATNPEMNTGDDRREHDSRMQKDTRQQRDLVGLDLHTGPLGDVLPARGRDLLGSVSPRPRSSLTTARGSVSWPADGPPPAAEPSPCELSDPPARVPRPSAAPSPPAVLRPTITAVARAAAESGAWYTGWSHASRPSCSLTYPNSAVSSSVREAR